MSLPDRERFVKFLAERFGLDGHNVWKSFIGNGASSGLLHQAKYHASPAGIAAAVDKQRSPLKIPLPESEHQRAWLRTWQSLLRNKNPAYAEAKTLIEIYLATVSGTGTVERWIKEKGDLAANRAGMHVRGLETSLKLLIQDQGGRRRETLCPHKMLVKDAPAKVAGGATVVYPASALLLKAQRKYAEFFGARTDPGRSWEVCGPKDLARRRVTAAKPRLGTLSIQRCKSDNSEQKQLEAHAQSCQQAIVEIQAGRSAEGIIGPVDVPKPDANRKRLFEDAAMACWELRSSRKGGPEQKRVAYVGQSASGAASSTSVPCGGPLNLDETQKAIVLQEGILAKRRKAAESAEAGKPVAYVDSKGGAMRYKPSKAESAARKPRSLPSEPKILLATSKPAGQVLPPNGTKVFMGQRADIVLVENVLLNYESAEALQARLDGARLMDLTGRAVSFQGAMQHQHLVLLAASSFALAYPGHMEVLMACSKRSPVMRVQGQSLPVKRFEVLETDSVPNPLRWPTLTYKISEDSLQDVSGQDSKGKPVKLQVLGLKGLLNLCGRCFDG